MKKLFVSLIAVAFSLSAMAASTAAARIKLVGSNSTYAVSTLYLNEDDERNSSYESGYDAESMLTQSNLYSVLIYAYVGEHACEFVATDNLDGQKITFKTNMIDSIYTLHFSNVSGRTLKLYDRLRDVETEITDGDTYQFTVNADLVGQHVVSGRFVINYVPVDSIDEDDTDIASFFSSRENQTISLKINRTLLKNGYFNTLCLPFDLPTLDGTPLEGAELYTFSDAEIEDADNEFGKQLRYVITPVTSLEAGQPYLIRWTTTGADITELEFNDVTIKDAMGAGVNPSALSGSTIQFVGIVPRTHIDFTSNLNYLFLAQNNSLKWPADGDNSTMKGFRAYFYVPDGVLVNNVPVRYQMPARLVIRQTPTDMETVSGEDSSLGSQKVLRNGVLYIERDGRLYDVQGQQVK